MMLRKKEFFSNINKDNEIFMLVNKDILSLNYIDFILEVAQKVLDEFFLMEEMSNHLPPLRHIQHDIDFIL